MIRALFVTTLAIFIAGCVSHFESVNQVNDSALLQLEGNFIGTLLFVDDAEPVILSENNIKIFSMNGKDVARFPISIGKHTIKIVMGNNVLVNRIIYVSSNNTFEVVVP